MPDRDLTTEQVLAILKDGPPRIAGLTAGLDPVQCKTAPGPDEWSINEVLAHLRACADVWGGCIATLLTQDQPSVRAVNPRTYMRHTDYPELEFQPSLQAFTAQRLGLLTVLEALAPEAWARSATVTGAGRVLFRTVYYYAQWLATHERPHVRQIGRIAEALRR